MGLLASILALHTLFWQLPEQPYLSGLRSRHTSANPLSGSLPQSKWNSKSLSWPTATSHFTSFHSPPPSLRLRHPGSWVVLGDAKHSPTSEPGFFCSAQSLPGSLPHFFQFCAHLWASSLLRVIFSDNSTYDSNTLPSLSIPAILLYFLQRIHIYLWICSSRVSSYPTSASWGQLCAFLLAYPQCLEQCLEHR